MRNRELKVGLLGALVLLVLGGCASTGGGADMTADAPAPAPKVDVKNEVGENGLLTPAAIVARTVEAMGGEAALRAHSSSTSKGKMIIAAMGMEGELTQHAAAPDKMVMVIDTPIGSVNTGYNGEVGWSDNPMTGSSVLEGSPLTQMKQQASFYGPLDYDEHYPSQETTEEVDFNGEMAYRVRMVDVDDNESFLYFSKESALLIGIQATREEGESTVRLSKYMDFGGTKRATVTTLEVQGMEIQNVIETVTFDDVEDGAFEPPDSIKSQL